MGLLLDVAKPGDGLLSRAAIPSSSRHVAHMSTSGRFVGYVNGVAYDAKEIISRDQYLGAMLGLGAARFEEAIPWLEDALRLSPKDPQLHIIFGQLALANLGVGNYEQAAECASESIRHRPDYFESVATLAAALGFLGRADEALATIAPFVSQARERIERNALFARETKDVVLDGLNNAGWEG